jgi:hypothetical protein
MFSAYIFQQSYFQIELNVSAKKNASLQTNNVNNVLLVKFILEVVMTD